MTSFFTTFTAGVPIDKRAEHFPPAAPESPVPAALETAPARRQRFVDIAVHATSRVIAALRRLRR